MQLYANRDQLMADKLAQKLKRERVPYVIHSPPWHPPHALRREYTMVLHQHKLEMDALAPAYTHPGISGLTV